MTHPGAPNNRFLLCSGTLSFPEYATILSNEFTQHGYKCTCFVAPRPIIWLTAFWDKQAANILPTIGKRYYIAGKNVQDILGLQVVNDVPSIIHDMSLAAIANGLIPDRSRDQTLTSSYVRPELDLTGIPTAQEIAQQLSG